MSPFLENPLFVLFALILNLVDPGTKNAFGQKKIKFHSSLQVDQISGKIEGQFLIPHARSDPRDLTQLHTKTKVDAGPDLMNPTYRFEYDGPEGNGSWREIQPLSLTGENVIFFFELLVSK